MASRTLNFNEIGWPLSRLGELAENLAHKAHLVSRPARLGSPPASLAEAGNQEIGQWLDHALGHTGLEAEPVSSLYADLEQLLVAGGPAILRLPGDLAGDPPRFIALIKGRPGRLTILCPDLRTRRISTESLRAAICEPYEASLGNQIDQVLADAQVPAERTSRARRAILRDQLAAIRIESGWLVRLSPGNSLHSLFRHNGVYKPVWILLAVYVVQQLLAIASWIVIGRGIFQGHFEWSWIFAWAILLLAIIPVQTIVKDTQAELSMGVGAIFKQRLIHGTLKLEPEEIRHQGMGQFLGRVMESEAVEMLALSGGLSAILSIVELGMAAFILSKGAGGVVAALALVIWVLITLLILWRYLVTSRDWSEVYREMTNDLVENMVGHRTRLIQEDPRHWHEDEDQSLDRYLKLSESMDRVGLQLNATITRGWLIVGFATIAIPYIIASPTPQALAIGLGGVLFASQGLSQLAGGAQSLVGLSIAWRQVGPLFRAAARPRDVPAVGFVPPARGRSGVPIAASEAQLVSPGEQPLLQARDIVFRYREHARPALEGCSLQINPGDRILLEGPSGGGKTTLGAVLTGLRVPETGSLLLWGFDRQMMGGEEWRRRVVMAPQFNENHVFSETFAFNLLIGRRWPPLPEDLEEAEAICRELGLGEVLDRMPSGFQQMLGESGWQLSHGERSRLFIARTLLQQADLIILDESFGALDPENLQRALQCVLERAPTVLVIAHP